MRPALRSWKTYLIGVPAVAAVSLVALFGWGQLQPKPQGYAPTAIEASANTGGTVAPAAPSAPSAPAAPSTAATASPPAPSTAEQAPAQPVGPVRYTVDARDQESWVFFSFASGGVVDSTFDAPGWDLAFRRTKLLTNSGETNPAGPGGAVDLGEGDLEGTVRPTLPEFAVDRLGGEDEDEVRNAAISRWYRYNFIRHVIVARANVYLVRTGGELDALVRFDSYYCDDESPGCVTFHYRLVPRASGGDDTTARP